MDFSKFLTLEVTPDNLRATLVLSPQVGDIPRPELKIEELLEFVQKKVAPDMVNQDKAREMLSLYAGPPNGEKLYVEVAAGTAAVDGEDGYVKWSREYFKSEHMFDADGRANYYEKSGLKPVAEKEKLGVIIDPTKGVPGKDVAGQELPAKDGVVCEIKAGDGVRILDDGKTIVAEKGGRLEKFGATLDISDVFRVDGDVDFSSGNIDFTGIVSIKGNVRDLFHVKAGKLIEVGGFVEGARLESGCDIRVQGGINAREKGLITADNDVFAKYVSNSEIIAKAHVYVGTNLSSSKIIAGDYVKIAKGSIVGGTTWATNQVIATVCGTPSGSRTVLIVGRDYFAEEEIKKIDKTIAEKDARAEQITGEIVTAKAKIATLTPEQKHFLKDGLLELKALRDEMEVMKSRKAELQKSMHELLNTAEVLVHDILYAGCEIQVGAGNFFIVNVDLKGPLAMRFNRGRNKVEAVSL
ncbi:MAG: FapA family protein [Planctomycetes bacterium]|nr:FapA family protein [Planctomycetota bacterium]